MAQRKDLLTVSVVTDDETGMYKIGEIDFGVSGLLYDYLSHHGKDGVRDILAVLGHLAWEVKEEYYSIYTKEGLGTTEGDGEKP